MKNNNQALSDTGTSVRYNANCFVFQSQYTRVWKDLEFYSLIQKSCFSAFLFNISSSLLIVIFLFSLSSHTGTHIQFRYQFKAQREVSEGACQSHKLSPKWWQIGRLSVHLPIKSRLGFHAPIVPVNGDRWNSGEAHCCLSLLCHYCHM